MIDPSVWVVYLLAPAATCDTITDALLTAIEDEA